MRDISRSTRFSHGLSRRQIKMSMVRNILAALLCLSPLCLLSDGVVVQGLVAGIIAVATAVTARSLRPGETAFLISVLRPAAMAAAIPALWVVVQILPLGLFAHPIWQSAATALHEPIRGSISIDPAQSVISLGHYLSLAAVAFLSAAVATDRQRAVWMLSALTIGTAASGLVVLGHWFVATDPASLAFLQATECVSLGMILAATSCVRAIEQYGLRRYRAHGKRQSTPIELGSVPPEAAVLALCALALCGLVTCGLALWLLAGREAIFAAACGLLTLLSVSVARRSALGRWSVAGAALPALVIAVLLIGSHSTQRALSAPLAFTAPSQDTALSQRMIDDAPASGIGAGTFRNLAPVYRADKDPPADRVAATAAAIFAIELGKAMLGFIVAATALLICVLLRASVQRGRDWLYPAAAAGALVTMLLQAFIDAGLSGTATGLIGAALIGLGLAQSKSRTAHI
jgi:hypothetical protein